jgi:peptidoglycan/LPS O-acetylase OafA/YrhL
MVVLHHVGLLSQAASLGWMIGISAPFAVQAFFVVSGFLVTMSFENSRSIRSYAVKRLRRIAPAYVVVVLAAATGLCSLSSLPIRDYFGGSGFWRYVGFNLCLSNFAAPTLPGVFGSNFSPAVNGSLWTIKIEVAFYCIVPLMVWAARKVGYKTILIAIFIVSVAWKTGFDALAAARHAKIYSELGKQLPGQMSYFVGGAWAYYRTREGRGVHAVAALAAVLLCLTTSGVLRDVLQPLSVATIVWWAAVKCPRLPSPGRHGDFSYGTYLYHFPLIQSVIALGVFRWSPLAGCLSVVAMVAGAAALSWHFVEHPALAAKRTQ